MAPTTSDECLTFLDEAKQALEEISDLTARDSDCRQKEQQTERAYESEKKKMNDEVSRTLKSRRDDIVKSYDDEINKDQDQLKKAKNKREKARNEGVKDRIADETSAFQKEITSLRTQIKDLGASEQLPAYCRSQLYMSLYYPKHPRDILTLFIGILIFFALIPCLIYLALPARKPVYLIVIYAVLFVVVLGIYIYTGIHANKEHAQAIKDCRALYDQIYERQRSISDTTKSIRQDTNEGAYDLGKYDDDISRIQQDLDDVTGRKQEALDNYENVTKNILTDEIEGNYKDKLDELSQAHADAEADSQNISAQLKSSRLNFSDNYSQLLGKEFSDPVKIDSLIQIVKEQKCQNISEAIAWYKTNEKQMKADERARAKKGIKAETTEAQTAPEDAAEAPADESGPQTEPDEAEPEATDENPDFKVYEQERVEYNNTDNNDIPAE